MLVYADAQALQSPITVERGIGRYVTELAVAIEQAHPAAVGGWILRPDMPVPGHAETLIRNARYRLQDDPDITSPDVWHATSPFESLLDPVERLWPTWARGAGTRLVATLYDLIPILYPERYLSNSTIRRAYKSRLHLVERADRVLAISEATANDGIRLLGIPASKFDVVGTGVSEKFVPPQSVPLALESARSAVPRLRPGYLLYTGGIDFRKNIDGLLLAYSMLPRTIRAQHQLVIVCRIQDSEREHLERQAEAMSISDDLLLTGFVPDDVLLNLYQAAHLFVFPSLYEGFGLPVVEALSCGVPALVGSNSSLTELVPDPRAHFDATSPDAISRSLFQVLSDDVLRTSLRNEARGTDYRWGVVAERTLEAYAAARTHTARVSALPRLALVSPMPPAASGVADYSMAVLRHLALRAKVDVFTSPDAARPAIPGVEWYSYSDFDGVERIRGTHDGRVFALGNSEHHVEPLRLLRAKGGTVMAHDVRYTGLMHVLRRDAPELIDPVSSGLLDDMNAGRRPAAHREHVAIPVEDYYTLNGLMCAPVFGDAENVLVHSNVASMLARANLPVKRRTRVRVVPFGHTARTWETPRPRDVVASFGIVHKTKESDTVCAAFIELAAMHPEKTFALVGEIVDQSMRDTLGAMLRAADLGDRVLLTGRVSEEEYDGWLRRACLAVQLRAHSNGESSAAVADCLGAEVAVVASNTGALAALCGITELVEPGVPVQTLVEVVDGLLRDDEHRADLAIRGREHAQLNSFDAAASAVLDFALRAR